MFWGIAILIICIVLGLPIYVGLLGAGLYILLIVQQIPIDMVITGLYDGVAKFTLTAVPFFLLAGSFMEKSSFADRLVKSFTPWLVKVRGGIPIAAILANELFGAMSGSAPAAAGTIGRVMFPVVSKSNSEKFALGMFASAGALAIVMPPSINMILFATATNASIGALFLAGVVPAIIIGVCLCSYIWFVSKPAGQDVKFDLKYAAKMTLKGLPVLILPVIVLGGIYKGAFTPTEAGAVSAVYAFLLPFLFYKELKPPVIKECIKDTTKLTGQIFILIAASTVFSQALAMAQVPEMLKQALSGLSPVMFLMILNVILLIVGCFFDPTSAVLVLAPVVAPVAASLGIDLLHLGIVFTVNLAIGMFTPPFGLNLYVIQSIFKRRLEDIARAVPPFFVVFIIALIIITYFPQLYLWLPKMSMVQ
ncbi:MAG: C4-dicarboxylate transporter, DctM subunit [Clostridia bacterium]|nr:C4-dicarboxylate transporter, DctM subunit [Clostridia bacterium]MDN5365710.1 C4-dicarboxylate transporter, DctM subunit [Thermacetogenium sp.]MDN5376434.1 C4-dicarboxylate transporter, DctM subunit [Thermacetogenium sp.]